MSKTNKETNTVNFDKKDYWHKLISKTHSLLNNLEISHTLQVDGFIKKDSNGIKINNPQYPNGIYAVELTTASNTANFLEQKDIDAIHRTFKYKNDAFLIWALIKKDLYQKNYIFSYNKDMIKFIADKYGVQMVKNNDMLNVLYDLTLDNDYKIDKASNSFKRVLDCSTNLDFKYVHETFNSIIGNAMLNNLEDMNLYQAVGYKQTSSPSRVSELFRLPFRGAIYTYVSFNKNSVESVANEKIIGTKFAESDKNESIRIMLDSVKEGTMDAVLMNTVALVDKKNDDDSIYSTIADCLNLIFKKHSHNLNMRKRIIKNTPLIKRHNTFSEIVRTAFLDNYICSVHKEQSRDAQMFGTDINGAFTSYNLKYPTQALENTRESFFVGGETGSSKTTFINTLKSQMIKFNWGTYKLGDMNGYKFREFDIKKSLRPFAEFVGKHNKNSVSILETRLNEFAYNLLSIKINDDDILDQEDLAFCKDTTSFILEAKDSTLKQGLEFDEDSLYGKLIEEVYVQKKYEHITISSLGYYQETLAKELLDLGYSPNTTLDKITQEEYQYLKKPTMQAVIALLNKMFTNNEITKDETKYKTVMNLRKKLTAIDDLGSSSNDGRKVPGYFSRYEAFDINSDKRWLLFDMDLVKGNKEYAPIQWILLNKMVNQDMKDQIELRKKGLPEPKIIYLLEEAHNVFSHPLFKSKDGEEGVLDKAAREWRSYNIILGIITQKSRHIPAEVYEAIETKFFLFPGDENKGKSDGESVDVQILGNKDNIGIKDLLGLKESSIELMMRTPKYHACAVNEHGTFVIKLDTTQKMRDVFDGKVSYDNTQL